MTSAWQVNWTKAQRRRASDDGKALFAVGVDNKVGRMEVTGLMDHAVSEKLLLFATLLYKGRAPGEAFAEVWGGEGEETP